MGFQLQIQLTLWLSCMNKKWHRHVCSSPFSLYFILYTVFFWCTLWQCRCCCVCLWVLPWVAYTVYTQQKADALQHVSFHQDKTKQIQSELLVCALACLKCVKISVSHVNKWWRQRVVTFGDTVMDCNIAFAMQRRHFMTRNPPTACRFSKSLFIPISILYCFRFNLNCQTLIERSLREWLKTGLGTL